MLNLEEPFLGEGNTPVLSLPVLARHFGLSQISAKAEWINPTGSYKDRIAAATIKDAVCRAQRGWIGTSSGNGGASMSAYGVRAGLPGFLCISASTPPEKLKSIIPYGTTLFCMSQLGLKEMDAINDLSIEFNLKMAVTAYRYNSEGMSGAELIGSELRAQGSFTHIYVPTGGGGLLVAIARGIYDATLKSPKVICAQPIGCGPISRFLSSELKTPSISACNSIISGLQLPTPPDGELAADAVRRTDGWGCLVEDEEAFQMQDLLSKKEGVFVEPASALALAAMINDFRSGRITKSDNPVAILTGTGLKDLRRFGQPDSSSTRIVALKELESAITTAFNYPETSPNGKVIAM